MSALYRVTIGAEAPTDFIRITETNKIDYRVNLKPDNGVVNKPFLGMNETYAYEIVDNIEINNNYAFDASGSVDTEFDYYATVSFITRISKGSTISDTDSIISDEVITTLNKSTVKESGGDATIKRSFIIDLETYREKFMEVKSNLSFPVSGQIRIDIQIDATDNGQLNNKFKRSITIPVSEPYFEVKLDGEEKRESELNAPTRDMIEMAILVGLGAGVIGSFALTVFFFKKSLNYKSWYRQEIDRILDDYNDAIIATTSPIGSKAYKEQIAVESFKEILQLATNIGDPIMYYETTRIAYFYILKDDILYSFTIRKTKEKPEEEKAIREIEAEKEKEEAGQ